MNTELEQALEALKLLNKGAEFQVDLNENAAEGEVKWRLRSIDSDKMWVSEIRTKEDLLDKLDIWYQHTLDRLIRYEAFRAQVEPEVSKFINLKNYTDNWEFYQREMQVADGVAAVVEAWRAIDND